MSPLSPPPDFFDAYRQQIDKALLQVLEARAYKTERLLSAMRHSTLMGGKRIRPILTLCTAQCFAAEVSTAMPAACAVELIHAYSLVHDDLPAMDDDALRRGQPTCHVAFDEATAILAGDALQALAFEVITKEQPEIASAQKLKMTQVLARASGAAGMVAGQATDLEAVGQTLSLEQLSAMHRMKTGALIRCATELGALCSPDISSQELEAIVRYSDAIGLGFQVQDDILDVTSETAVLGKTQGADEELNKPTYPALLGLEGAKQQLRTLHNQACEALDSLQGRDATALKHIADYIVTRVF